MYRCLLGLLLLLTPALCLDVKVRFGNEVFQDFSGYPENFEALLQEVVPLYLNLESTDTTVDFLQAYYIYEIAPFLYDTYLNTQSFAPWPAAHTTIFAPPDQFVGVDEFGIIPFYYEWLGINNIRYYPGEYLGFYFDVPATLVYAQFLTSTFEIYDRLSYHYYYHSIVDYVSNFPYENAPFNPEYWSEVEFIFPFHVTAKTQNGYYYYDWLVSRASQEFFFEDFEIEFSGPRIYALYKYWNLLAKDPRGIELLKVYGGIPENNRRGIYKWYDWEMEEYQIPEFYSWLYLEFLVAEFATPSSTRTISPSVSPSPNFLRQPSQSATRSPSVTHTAGTRTPTASHTPIYISQSNTPTRTPNLSSSGTPTRSLSPVPSASPPASASAIGPSATSTNSATRSLSRSPVTPTTTPTVTKTATGTRTAFLTASNTQAPGRNVPSVSIAPSSSPASVTFSQPSSSTAVLVQFNVLCTGYCTGESAIQLQTAIARALNLNEEFIRIVAIHEFFEGDSEITILICSNKGVDTLLNSIQSGSFTQQYFISLSIESVDWTVKCDIDLYNYLALSSQYIDTASSSSALLPVFVLFFLQLWVLA